MGQKEKPQTNSPSRFSILKKSRVVALQRRTLLAANDYKPCGFDRYLLGVYRQNLAWNSAKTKVSVTLSGVLRDTSKANHARVLILISPLNY